MEKYGKQSIIADDNFLSCSILQFYNTCKNADVEKIFFASYENTYVNQCFRKVKENVL